jgi:hypothetical protein
LTENLWGVLILGQTSNLPPVASFQQQQQLSANFIQSSFLYQQLNLLIELIIFRFKHLSFTHRTTFLFLLNSLYSQQPQQPIQQATQQPQQLSTITYIKHPQIYIKFVIFVS